jgi:glycosyltransferase involved in cell wall biosynthesis
MTADRTNVAALIPAYCEEKHIADVVRRAFAQLDTVLVVDDGSPDATAAEASKAGAQLLKHDANRGKGAAIKTGLRHLAERGFRWILILDGDGQHRPEEIPRFLAEAGRGPVLMLVGDRMAERHRMPPVRRATNRLMSSLISRICDQPIPDTQCGFRMLHRDVVPLLFCESDAYEYETEMLFRASGEGIRIASVPVSTLYGDEKSKIRPLRDTLRFIRLLFRYRNSADGAAR